MNVSVEKKSKEQMMSMPIEDLEKIVELAGVGLVLDNGEVSAISVGDEEIFSEKESNPITATLAMALEEAYGKLDNARRIIDGLTEYIMDNVISIEEDRDVAIEKVAKILNDMGVAQETIDDLSQNLSSLLKSDFDYGALSKHFPEPDEDFEF